MKHAIVKRILTVLFMTVLSIFMKSIAVHVLNRNISFETF